MNQVWCLELHNQLKQQTNDFPLHHRYLLVARQLNIPTLKQGKISLAKLRLDNLIISSAWDCLLVSLA